MTTVTGMTADRMLAIENASVVDGDVDASGNLILTKHDGTKINAGPVIGPQGIPGPVGQDKSVLAAVPILDVGITGQIRAGRQLSPADFGNLGLGAPTGLWNLSDLTDASGNGRNLLNKGAVPFAAGINGGANTAAQFVGAVGQGLYIADTGAADPFRLRTLSAGCWFRTAKRGTFQMLVDKYGTAAQQCYSLHLTDTNQVRWGCCPDGTANNVTISGVSDVCDDKWHFVVATFDGALQKIYVDGVLEATLSWNVGMIFQGASALNIGGRGADGSTNAAFPHFGRIDEAFITGDILTEDQVRNLYCAKIAHTLGAVPVRVSLNVHRRRKGVTWAVSDFPTQPLRLHNFSAGSMGDQGSNNQTLTNNGGASPASAADGTTGNAINIYGGVAQNLSSTDTGLPSGLASRSYGCWMKSVSTAVGTIINIGGTAIGTGDVRLGISTGNIFFTNGPDGVTGPFVCDGNWHHLVITEDNAAADGVKRKLYIDGKIALNSTVMNAITLAGANRFRIGTAFDGTSQPYTGQVDGVFICDYVLTTGQILALFAKGAQDLGVSPKNSGDHVEKMDATSLLVAFDTLDSQHQVDLAVA